jgi:hypothetical protein
MMTFLEFTFQSFGHFFGMALMLVFIIEAFVRLMSFIWNRFWRHMTLRKHGYPPPHCDADGDFPETETSETENKTN